MEEHRTKRRILVVDDGAVDRRLMDLYLKRAGFDVAVARHGVEAQEAMAKEPPDMILLDLMMPVMDGMKFLRWLRQEAHNDTPVFVLTAAVEDNAAERALAAGANQVLHKPVDAAELLRALGGHD